MLPISQRTFSGSDVTVANLSRLFLVLKSYPACHGQITRGETRAVLYDCGSLIEPLGCKKGVAYTDAH